MNVPYSYKPLEKKGYVVSKTEWGTESNACMVRKNNTLIYFNDYPNCCGSILMYDLETYDDASTTLAVEMMKDIMEAALTSENRNHFNYISLESGQEWVNEVLTEVGFKQVDTFRNVNTGNMCIVWSLNYAQNE